MSHSIPFPPPNFLSARLTVGSVDLSTHESLPSEAAWETKKTSFCSATEAVPPPSLERTETISRRILEIETQSGIGDDKNSTPVVAFWLQRKLGVASASRDVVARLGYRLRPRKQMRTLSAAETSGQDSWELEKDEEGRPILVRVHTSGNGKTLWNELGALQRIAAYQEKHVSPAHVVGTNLIAADRESNHVYAILPYHGDGTLLQFCHSRGSLQERLARFIFGRILKGLKTLKAAGMCHRNLSLDTIAMDGDRVDIVGLGWALLCDDSNATKGMDGDTDGGDNHSLPPTPGGSDPRFISPESFYSNVGNTKESSGTTSTTTSGDYNSCHAWNGFRDDLWAAGLILYSMVVGTNALFAAPIAGDKRFSRLCIRGDIKGEAKRFQKCPSDDLANLLQSMLCADPKRRLSLEQVMKHPWVVTKVSVTPTSCTATTTTGLQQDLRFAP